MDKRASASSTSGKAKKRCNYTEDYLSQMPHDVLVSILSCLPLKEAAKTSVLSRRWTYLWTFVPRLSFDAGKKLNEVILGRKSLVIQRLWFENWVNEVIRSCQAPSLEEFKVMFDLNSRSAREIDKWITFAFAKGVKRLDLNLSSLSLSNECTPYNFLPIWIILEQSHSRPVASSNYLFLTSLQLDFVNISGEVLECLLSKSLSFEHLSVRHSQSLVNLAVSGSLTLKYLEICYCPNMKNLEISATNLISLVYDGPRIKVSLKNAPKLAELSVGGRSCEDIVYYVHKLSNYLPQLRKLVLSIYAPDTLESLAYLEIPSLRNLKELELIMDADPVKSLLGCTAFVNAAPFLSKCTLKFECTNYGSRRPVKVTRCSHFCLKVVELIGWVGQVPDTELALYFLENAVALDKIIFDTRSPFFIGSPWEYQETSETIAAKNRAMLLMAKFQTKAEFIIL